MAKIKHITDKHGEVVYPISKEGAIYDDNGVLLSSKIATFITRLVDNLANYYLKSETYTKGEVDSMISAIQGFTCIVVSELPTASTETMGAIYLVPSEDPQTQNIKDEYITIRSGVEGSYTYSWEQIGSTAIDLSGYVTTEALNTELAKYTTTANLTTLLAGKQDTIADLASIRSGASLGATAYQKPNSGIPASDIAAGVIPDISGKQDVIPDLSTIRSGAAAGATAYQKPSGGIPKTDLESGVQDSLDLADSAVQADPVGSVTPPVTPSDWATAEQVEELEAKVGNIFPSSIFDHSSFASYNYNIRLLSTIGLYAPGDYLEMKVKGNNAGYMLIATAAYNDPTIRYASGNTIQIRFTMSDTPFNYQNSAVNNQTIQIIKLSLDSVSGTTYNYSIYLDGNKIGTQSITSGTAPNWDNLGYQSTMDLYYIRGVSNGVAFEYAKFADLPGATSVTDVYTTQNYDGLIPLNERVDTLESEMSAVKKVVESEDFYYEYHHTSGLWQATHDYCIYQRLYGNTYVMFAVIYYYATSVYPAGYWRIERARLVTVNDGAVSVVQDQIITAGENEFVLRWLAGDGYNADGGFTGGFHFGEKIDGVTGAWVEFIVDGNQIAPTEDIPLTPCKSFLYREYSAIYNCHDNPATIAAWHLKETEFKGAGYETINDVKFVQALDYFAYPGIVCVGRWLSEYAMPEGVSTITDMGDGSTTIAEQFKSNGHRIHYEGNGYMCDVESEVLIGADDAQCQRVVYNSSAYNKYYRRNPDTAGSTSNRLKGRTKVKISAM